MSGRWALLSALLRERAVVVSLFLFAVVYLIFSLFEVSLWRCTFRELTGWRCAGCGLTTGCKAFLRGDFLEGVAWNWLTPGVLLGLLLVPVVISLPKELRERAIDRLEFFEKRSRLGILALVLVILQTFARLEGWA